jgi:hypothetical protein
MKSLYFNHTPTIKPMIEYNTWKDVLILCLRCAIEVGDITQQEAKVIYAKKI